jgi:hypothetical protein
MKCEHGPYHNELLFVGESNVDQQSPPALALPEARGRLTFEEQLEGTCRLGLVTLEKKEQRVQMFLVRPTKPLSNKTVAISRLFVLLV